MSMVLRIGAVLGGFERLGFLHLTRRFGQVDYTQGAKLACCIAYLRFMKPISHRKSYLMLHAQVEEFSMCSMKFVRL